MAVPSPSDPNYMSDISGFQENQANELRPINVKELLGSLHASLGDKEADRLMSDMLKGKGGAEARQIQQILRTGIKQENSPCIDGLTQIRIAHKVAECLKDTSTWDYYIRNIDSSAAEGVAGIDFLVALTAVYGEDVIGHMQHATRYPQLSNPEGVESLLEKIDRSRQHPLSTQDQRLLCRAAEYFHERVKLKGAAAAQAKVPPPVPTKKPPPVPAAQPPIPGHKPPPVPAAAPKQAPIAAAQQSRSDFAQHLRDKYNFDVIQYTIKHGDINVPKKLMSGLEGQFANEMLSPKQQNQIIEAIERTLKQHPR